MAALVRRALAEVCAVPVLLVDGCHAEHFAVVVAVDPLLDGQQCRRALTAPVAVVDASAPAAADARSRRRFRHGGGRLTGDEQPTERLPELVAHAAVDEEVERVAEEDDEVGDERGGAARARVHQHQRVEGVLDDHGRHHDGERQLDEQEHADDDDQHQRRHVGLGEPARLGVHVLAQQAPVMLLGASHRHQQPGVETDQQDARHHVNKRQAKIPAHDRWTVIIARAAVSAAVLVLTE